MRGRKWVRVKSGKIGRKVRGKQRGDGEGRRKSVSGNKWMKIEEERRQGRGRQEGNLGKRKGR